MNHIWCLDQVNMAESDVEHHAVDKKASFVNKREFGMQELLNDN